jgi:thiamine biosynthesis lipoprotein
MVERARPLLGTYVSIRVSGLAKTAAHCAIDAAFAEVALIHDRMSFHDPASDVGRINCGAFERPIVVNSDTFEVLRCACEMAARSRGAFDPTVASQLVSWRLLPRPHSPQRPDPEGSWRDIEFCSDSTVRFRRPLWVDLGGIAKGYAVDRAIVRLRASGVGHACVNAGGDLRVLGSEPERIWLRLDGGDVRTLPVIEIENGSVASSSGRRSRRWDRGHFVGPHVDGRYRRAVGTGSFVSVVAESCMVADALTKTVLANRRIGVALLRHYSAVAYLHTARGGWRTLGGSA